MGACERQRKAQSVCVCVSAERYSVSVFVCAERYNVCPLQTIFLFPHKCVCAVTVLFLQVLPFFSLFVACVGFHKTPYERNESSIVCAHTCTYLHTRTHTYSLSHTPGQRGIRPLHFAPPVPRHNYGAFCLFRPRCFFSLVFFLIFFHNFAGGIKEGNGKVCARRR